MLYRLFLAGGYKILPYICLSAQDINPPVHMIVGAHFICALGLGLCYIFYFWREGTRPSPTTINISYDLIKYTNLQILTNVVFYNEEESYDYRLTFT